MKFNGVVIMLMFALIFVMFTLYQQVVGYSIKQELIPVSCNSPRPCRNPYHNFTRDGFSNMFIEPYETITINLSEVN